MITKNFFKSVTFLSAMVIHHACVVDVVHDYLENSVNKPMSIRMNKIVVDYPFFSFVGTCAFFVTSCFAVSALPPVPSHLTITAGFIAMQTGIAAGAYSSLIVLDEFRHRRANIKRNQSNN